MAASICAISKGRWAEFANRVANNDPATACFVLILLKVAEAQSTLDDYATLAALLAGSNTECDFTNYDRIVINSGVTFGVTTGVMYADFGNQTWSSAGGATNNDVVMAVLCYGLEADVDTDANLIPVAVYDAVITTNGSDLVFAPNASGLASAT